MKKLIRTLLTFTINNKQEGRGIFMKKRLFAAAIFFFVSSTAFCLSNAHAATLYYSDFFRVLASNISIGGSRFTFVEFKKPYVINGLKYAKIRIAPSASNVTIKRVIPVKIDPQIKSAAIITVKIITKILEQTVKVVAKAVPYAEMVDLIEECADLYYQNLERSGLEIELTQLDANGAPLYFLVETSASSTLGVGVTYTNCSSCTMMTSFSSDYPGYRAPF